MWSQGEGVTHALENYSEGGDKVAARRVNARRGFALVIALSLMAFVLLLVISLTSLIQVETATADNAKTRLLARQNALLGMQIALGKLQASAGPDRRATGRLEVDADLNVDPSKRYWTGVWRNDSSGGDPYDEARNVVSYSPVLEDKHILVSGEPTRPTLVDPATGPVLVGDSDTMLPVDFVRAPSVSIEGDAASGNYAFWVGDEGIKAKADIRDPAHLPTSEPSFIEADAPSRLLSMPRFGIEKMRLAEAGDEKIGDRFPAADSSLDLVGEESDLALLFAEGDEFARARFHDLTVHSKGVLSDQRLGGLRRDLTWMLRNDALPEGALYSEPINAFNRANPLNGPAWSLIQDFYKLADQPVLSPQGGGISRSIENLDGHQNAVAPIITQLKLYFNFALGPEDTTSANPHGGHLRMYLFPLVVLYNPYNEPLAERDYLIELPQHNTLNSTELRVEILDSAGDLITSFGGYKFKDGLNALFSPQAKSGSNDRSGRIRFRAPDLGFAAGETKVLTLAETAFYDGRLNSSMVTHSPSGEGNILAPGFDESNSAIVEFSDTLAADSDPAFYSFELVRSGVLRLSFSVLDGAQSEQLAFFGSIAYNKFDEIPTAAVERGSGLSIFPKAGFSYKVDLAAIRHLADFNLRSDYLVFSGFDEGAPLSTPPRLFKGDFGIGDFVTNTDGSGGGFFGPSHTGSGFQQTALFEIPAGPEAFVSLGQLRHLDLSIKHMNPNRNADRANLHAPTYILGNSLADPRVGRAFTYRDFKSTTQWFNSSIAFDHSYRSNEALLDGFFFSTLPRMEDLENGDPPVNRRLVRSDQETVTQDDAFDAAEQWMIEGAFNVNSTSVDAWRALLSGLQGHDLTTQQAGTESDVDFLFPNTTQPLDDSFLKTPALDGFSAEVWRGARKLSEAEIDSLAEAIVEQVKERGPFLSLADFVNRDLDATGERARAGALQLAIENAGLNGGLGGPAITVPPDGLDVPESDLLLGHAFDQAPGHINQSSLLSPLIPTLVARSDTFRVRAYGDVTNPFGEPAGASALCEAIVQRLPEKVDPSEAIELPTSADGFGRSFRVVAFRWLDPPNIP